jgi:hypothetical protein
MKRIAVSIVLAAAVVSALAQVNRPLPPSSVNNVHAVDSFIYPAVPSADQIRGLATGVMLSACGAGQVLSGGACVATSSFSGVPTVAKFVETFAGRSATVSWPYWSATVSVWIDGNNVCAYAANLGGGTVCVGKYGPTFSATNGSINLGVSPLGLSVSQGGGNVDGSVAYTTTWDSSQLTYGQGPYTSVAYGLGASP